MIIQNPNKILRNKSSEVLVKDISSFKIQNIIEQMKKDLIFSKENGGVALAAPQIGYNLRIFIIIDEIVKMSKKQEIELAGGKKQENNQQKFVVFINPQIIKESRKKMSEPEGCLSVAGTQGKVKRAEKVTVAACDENGKEFKMSASGILAQAVQHEMDHLNGILFIDKATELTVNKNKS